MSATVFGARQLFAAMTLCLVIGGCGGDMDIAPVSGTVTLDGEPLEGASVVFQPEGGRPSFGVTDSQGRYTLLYARDQNGAEVGECTVKISTFAQGDGPAGSKTAEKVPERFAQEPIKAVVEPKRNTIDIDLTSQP